VVGARRLPIQTRASTGYVRATDSILSNSPDGWVADQPGPFWWVNGDQLTDYGLGDYGFNPWQNHVYGGQPYSSQFPGYGSGGILSAVTRATAIIVGPVIRTTWRYLEGTNTDVSDVAGGTATHPRPLWVADPQLRGKIPGGDGNRPTIPYPKRLGAHDFWKTALAHALWFGLGAIMYAEDAFGQPLAGTLRVINPDRWAFTDDGRYVLDPGGDQPLESDFDGYFNVGPYRWRQVLIRGFAPNDNNTPEGALTRSGLLLATGRRMDSYLGSVLGSGVPSGVLKVTTPNFGKADADTLKARWMEAHGGTRKAVAVLNAGVDFTPLQLSVVDSDAVAAKAAWLVDLAHAFNLSAAYLDAGTAGGGSLTYSNLVDRRRDLLDLTLSDWGRAMEDLITSILPYGMKMRVDWSGFLNIDPSRDLAFVKQGLEMGYLTVEEARDRLGLPPLEVTNV
jgi:HK97 family phage portal protein